LTEAAHGGLKPSPTGRLRRVLLHLSYSMALSHLLDTTPPRLFTAAAWSGLGPAPENRSRGANPFGTLVLAVCAAWTSPLASERQVLTFRTRAWLSFAPPTCRMPLGQASGFSRADPGGRDTPRFRHRLIRFRHFIDGSLALASLNLACRDQVPAFPQRCRVGPGSFTPSRSQIRT
jgi:hypothetical protein